MREIDGAGLDAIVINASGCGTTVKDYGEMFANDPLWKERAEQVARLAKDVSELMVDVGLRTRPRDRSPWPIIQPVPCSTARGDRAAQETLSGRRVRREGRARGPSLLRLGRHLSVLQPELSRRLRDRKVANIESVPA